MPYIASTMAANVDYTDYQVDEKNGGANVPVRKVTVKGGSGVARKGGESGVMTPDGVVTRVTDEELSFLMNHAVFKKHLGFEHVKVLKSNQDGERAARDMNKKDPSGQLTDDDLKDNGRIMGAKLASVK